MTSEEHSPFYSKEGSGERSSSAECEAGPHQGALRRSEEGAHQGELHRVALLLSYDGGPYAGWQVQPKARTVQGVLEEALSRPLRKETSIIGASRTDAGVHALGQVAHFNVTEEVELSKLHRSLNGLLPPSIRCRALAHVAPRFHSQLSARGKLYTYRLQLGPVRDPLRRSVTAHWPYACDLDLLRAGGALFVGTHDFAAFANANLEGQAARGSVRTIWRLAVEQVDDELRIHVEGNGFLYKMVRNLVGALLEVAQGRAETTLLKQALRSKDRSLLPPPAPSEGLCLVRIDHDQPFAWCPAP